MDYTDIGSRIREARRAAGMTQEALAEAAELSVGYIVQLESSKKRARLDTLARIADALNIPLTLLYVGREVNAEALYALFDGCTEGERHVILNVALVVKESLRKYLPISQD